MKLERSYYRNGQIESETWRNQAGDVHRLDGTASRSWYENGQLCREEWYVNNKRHRLNGPAYRGWCSDGRPWLEVWYINGVYYKAEAEYLVAVDLYKANEIVELF